MVEPVGPTLAHTSLLHPGKDARRLTRDNNKIVSHPVRQRFLPALLVLLLAIACLSLILNQLHLRHEQTLHDHFEAETTGMTAAIHWHMSAYAQTLHGAAGLFSASGEVTRAGWKRYVEQLNLDQVYGGIQGVGYSQYIPAANLDAHQQAVRGQGFPDYRVTPAGKRESYSSIVYLEPFSGRNLRAFGYDMLSEPVRRAAMERARDTGAVAFSGKVTLMQETDQDIQAGILAYYPVYAQGVFPRTVRQRREVLLGWTYSPYRMSDMIEAILKDRLASIDLEIFDSAERLDVATLLYDSRGSADRHGDPPRFAQLVRLQLEGGRTWTLRYSALPSFDASTRLAPPWAEFAAVFIISLLLCGLTWALINTRRRADLIADEMTTSLRESQREFRGLSERLAGVIWGTNIGTWEWDVATGNIICNARWAEIVGHTLDDLSPIRVDTWRRLVHPDDLKRSDAELERGFRQESDLYECEVRMRHKDGRWVWVLDRGRVLEWDADDRPLRMSGTHQDITARKETEVRLQLAASVFSHAREGIIITDSAGFILDANQPFTQITGYSRQEALGRPAWLLHAGRQPEAFFQTLRQAAADTGHWSGETWNRHKSGEIYVALLTISAVKEDTGAIQNYVALFNDITPMKARQKQLEHIAYHDALTGLPNRLLLADRMQQAMAMADRNRQHLAVIYLDLDGFKEVNDSHGHDAGDELLAIVAQRMKAGLREIDTLARIGGDEFVAILAGLERTQDCESVLERLLRAVAEPIMATGVALQVSASIGATFYPQPGVDAEQLLQQADQAMYRAKYAGKNCFQLFHSTTPPRRLLPKVMESQLS